MAIFTFLSENNQLRVFLDNTSSILVQQQPHVLTLYGQTAVALHTTTSRGPNKEDNNGTTAGYM